eukprot:SAG31_NODE_8008_length_1542_cov_2.801109_3_plen_104_part_01
MPFRSSTSSQFGNGDYDTQDADIHFLKPIRRRRVRPPRSAATHAADEISAGLDGICAILCGDTDRVNLSSVGAAEDLLSLDHQPPRWQGAGRHHRRPISMPISR